MTLTTLVDQVWEPAEQTDNSLHSVGDYPGTQLAREQRYRGRHQPGADHRDQVTDGTPAARTTERRALGHVVTSVARPPVSPPIAYQSGTRGPGTLGGIRAGDWAMNSASAAKPNSMTRALREVPTDRSSLLSEWSFCRSTRACRHSPESINSQYRLVRIDYVSVPWGSACPSGMSPTFTLKVVRTGAIARSYAADEITTC